MKSRRCFCCWRCEFLLFFRRKVGGFALTRCGDGCGGLFGGLKFETCFSTFDFISIPPTKLQNSKSPPFIFLISNQENSLSLSSMLRHHILVACKSQCRRSFTTTPTKRVHQIPSLLPRDATLETFRTQAFNPALPILLPEQFTHLPAIKTWFLKDSNTGNISLNRQYLDQFGETIVPLEITTQEGKFMRVEQELSWFLE